MIVSLCQRAAAGCAVGCARGRLLVCVFLCAGGLERCESVQAPACACCARGAWCPAQMGCKRDRHSTSGARDLSALPKSPMCRAGPCCEWVPCWCCWVDSERLCSQCARQSVQGAAAGKAWKSSKSSGVLASMPLLHTAWHSSVLVLWSGPQLSTEPVLVSLPG